MEGLFTIQRDERGDNLYLLKEAGSLRAGDVFLRKNPDGKIETIDAIPNIDIELVDSKISEYSEYEQYDLVSILK